MSVENKTPKMQAEIRFDNSQSDFKRFFDINLNQLSWVFKLGIGTVLAGMVAVIFACLNLVPVLPRSFIIYVCNFTKGKRILADGCHTFRYAYASVIIIKEGLKTA